MSDLVSEIDRRDLKACHVLLASMLGELANKGFLNQGVLNTLIPKIADKLAIYIKHKYREMETDDLNSLIKNTIEKIINELDAFINYKIYVENYKVTLIIDGSTCKFCPKGVGGAQLPGILCLFPQLFKEILTRIIDVEIGYMIPEKIIKKGQYCITQFKIQK